MKKINQFISRVLPALVIVTFFIQSCSEAFLELPPEDNVTDGDFYLTDDQVMSTTAILYNLVWFDYSETASFNLGDFRGGSVFDAYSNRDNVEFKTTANTPQNGTAWRSFYNVVGQANSTMFNINKYSGSGVSEDIKRIALAECKFMRAVAYEHLVMNWGPVPIIENNIDLLENPLSVKRNTIESVWQFITNDYLAAAQDLPNEPLQEGRLTRWSAEAMLARTYLTRAGVEHAGGSRNQSFLDSAKYYSQRVIELSGASLLENYEDLWIYPYDNNSESLFSLQWTFAPDEWGSNNPTISQITPGNGLGNGAGWGEAKGATFWMLSLYDGLDLINDSTLEGNTLDSRLHATFMLPGVIYEELSFFDGSSISTGYQVPDDGGTLGENQEFAFIKKYVVGDLPPDEASSQHHSHDTYMMRLAEMYLTYAEAELGNAASTSDATAVNYFNTVHFRATGQNISGSITLNDLFEERTKEFAMESRTWYELVRLHYYNPNLAYEIISNQDRGFYSIEPDNIENPNRWTIQKIAWDNNRQFSASSANFQLPLPATEVSAAPNLLEEPVPYEF